VSATWVPCWIRRFGLSQSERRDCSVICLPAPPHRVEDPWGRSDGVYAMTFERIASAVQRLAQILGPSGW